MTTESLVVVASSSVIETELDGDISIYDPTRESVTVLNSTASDIWRLADGEHTVDQIVDLLAGAYQVEPEAIRQQVKDAVQELVDGGLLRLVPQ